MQVSCIWAVLLCVLCACVRAEVAQTAYIVSARNAIEIDANASDWKAITTTHPIQDQYGNTVYQYVYHYSSLLADIYLFVFFVSFSSRLPSLLSCSYDLISSYQLFPYPFYSISSFFFVTNLHLKVALFKAAYDATSVYFYVTVTDSTPLVNAASQDSFQQMFYEGDALSITFGPRAVYKYVKGEEEGFKEIERKEIRLLHNTLCEICEA
jgi:hypothetical protein